MGFREIILESIVSSFRKFPDRNALCISDVFYTYKQLSERVSAIRTVIRKASDNQQIWGVAIEDNINTYAGILALWMEGKSYVPLHPLWPNYRIEEIREQVGFDNTLEDCDAEYKNDLLDDWAVIDDDALAYILFTSGSTGKPKGVQISRKNVSSFMDSFWKTGIVVSEKDRCMQIFDLTFDVSVQGFLVPFMRGACCYTVPYGQVKYVSAVRLIQEYKITFGAMAPSMLSYLKPYFGEFDASSMKISILTAEACPVDLLEGWFECAKNTEIYDFYGPTEATIYCTYYKLVRGKKILSLNGVVSIGKPLSNVKAIIINEKGVEIASSDKERKRGELCVAGDQVTIGYWNNVGKNEKSFFIKDNMKYYHTGDLCCWDSSGNILYSGRIDQQAKIQGFRVELGEIEYHAREFFENKNRVVAIAFVNDKKLDEIALFVEKEEENPSALIEYLRLKMPQYMIPNRIIYLSHFPLNKSEKIDKNSLKLQLDK